MMNFSRRRLFAAMAAVIVLPSAALAQTSRSRLVMMSAEDCPPCHKWKERVLPVWQKTPQYDMIDFTIIEGSSIRRLDDPKTWITGREFQWVYDLFLADYNRWTRHDTADVGFVNPRTAPRFILTTGHTIAAVGVGINGWRGQILPALKELTGVEY